MTLEIWMILGSYEDNRTGLCVPSNPSKAGQKVEQSIAYGLSQFFLFFICITFFTLVHRKNSHFLSLLQKQKKQLYRTLGVSRNTNPGRYLPPLRSSSFVRHVSPLHDGLDISQSKGVDSYIHPIPAPRLVALSEYIHRHLPL